MSYNYQNGNTQVQGGQQKEERKKLRLDVKQHDEFPSTVGTALMTSMKLTKDINALFRSAGIQDFYGSRLDLNQSTGQLELAIFFKPENHNGNGVYFVEPASAGTRQGTTAAFNRISSMDARNSGRTIQLTQDGKDVFDELIFKNYNQKVDWNRYAIETVENGNFGNCNLYLQVINININQILKKIWGDRTEDGSRLDYQVSVVRYVAGSPNMILSIQQLNEKTLNKLAEEVGIVSGIGSLGIVR